MTAPISAEGETASTTRRRFREKKTFSDRCPKPAVAAAERAVKLLADAPERKEAEAVLAFNRRIAEAAKSLD